MADEWITVKQAAIFRNCSEKTILKYLKTGKLEGKQEGRFWRVNRKALEELEGKPSGTVQEDSQVISILRAQLEEKDKQIAFLQEEMSQSRDQSNQLLAAMTKQNQLMLEDKTTPWYQRWFRKKVGAGEGSTNT